MCLLEDMVFLERGICYLLCVVILGWRNKSNVENEMDVVRRRGGFEVVVKSSESSTEWSDCCSANNCWGCWTSA